jgi:hypothetical protein
MERKRPELPSEDSRSTHQNLDDELSALDENILRDRKPSKAKEILEVFKAAGDEGVTLEQLLPFFEGTEDKARKAVGFISILNDRYLQPHGLRIERSPAYRIIRSHGRKQRK